jgi:hypothetical protein
VRRGWAVVATGLAGALVACTPVGPAGGPAVTAAGPVVVSLPAGAAGAPAVVRADVLRRVARWEPEVAAWWGREAVPVHVEVAGAAGDLPARDRPAGGTGWAAAVLGPVTAQRLVVAADGWARLSDRGRDLTVVHELAHAAARAEVTGPLPAWLEEGHAEQVARRLVGAATAAGSGWRRGSPPQSGDFGGADAAAAYDAAAGMVGELTRRLGDAGVRRLMVALAQAPVGEQDAVLGSVAGLTERRLLAEASRP